MQGRRVSAATVGLGDDFLPHDFHGTTNVGRPPQPRTSPAADAAHSLV